MPPFSPLRLGEPLPAESTPIEPTRGARPCPLPDPCTPDPARDPGPSSGVPLAPRASVRAPFSRFSAALLASLLVSLGVVVSISARTVGRWLKAERLKPWRFQSWLTPKYRASFLEQACPILDLYERAQQHQLAPDEVVFSIDEKTSIQARHHPSYRPTGQGEPAHVEHTYERRGAVHLLASLTVATGVVFGQVYPAKRFAEFSAFLSTVLHTAVDQGARLIHLLLDRGSLHRPAYLSTWLAEHFPHAEIVVHWLPVRSSWLNQVEIFFSILQRQVLMPNDFRSPWEVADRIQEFIRFRNEHPHPIQWSYTSEKLRKKYQPERPPS